MMEEKHRDLNAGGAFGRLAANPFVGRHAPVETARAAFENAQQGLGQSLLVFGESGIGKTRLADEMIGLSQSLGIRPIAARCHELDGAPALWPWIQLVRPLLATLEEEQRDRFLETTGNPLARLIPELVNKSHSTTEGLGIEANLDRYAVFDSMTHLVSLCAHGTPLFLVIDDLHWADPASVLLARYALRELRRDPVVFLGLYRDTDVEVGSPLAQALLDLQKESDSFQIQGLDESEIAKLVDYVAGFEVSPAFLAALKAQTGGNPLFMVEILRMLANEGKLGSPSSPSPEPTPLPQSVRHTLERRLRLLAPDTLDTLHRAGILGREFDREVLEFTLHGQGSAGPAAEVDVASQLSEVLAARLIERVPDQPARFRFAHDLVRETLETMLTDACRARLHRDASAALLATRASRLEEHYVELARHAVEALVQGVRDEESVSSARAAHRYSVLAARRATSSFSFELAVQLYRQALRALDFLWALDGAQEDRDKMLGDRGSVLIEMGDALWQTGLADEASEADREAEGIARRLGDRTLLARAAIGLSGRNDLPLDPSEDQASLLVEALEGIPQDDSHLRVRLLAHLVRATSFGAHRSRLTDWATEAVAIAESLDNPAALFAARESLHYALLMPERLEERLRVSEELPDLAKRAGSLRLEAIGWLWRVFDLLQVPDPVATDAAMARFESATVRLRQPFWRWLAFGVRACKAQMEGDLAEVERLIFKALEVGQRASARNAMMFFGTQLIHLRAEQRRADELLPVMKKIVADNPGLLVFRIGVPLIHVLAGREEEARRTFDEVAANHFEDVAVDFHRLPMLTSAAAVAAFLGDAPRARALLEALKPDEGRVIVAGVVTYWVGSVDRSLGQLEETLGLSRDALRHYASAAAVAGKAGARLLEAHALDDQARVLRRLEGLENLNRADALERRAQLIYEERGIHNPVAIVPRIAAGFGEAWPESVARVDEEGRTSSQVHSTPPGEVHPARFIRLNQTWHLEFQGRSIDLPESKGLAYLHCLLSRPETPIHALALVGLEQGGLSEGALSALGAMENEGHRTGGGASQFLEGGIDAIDHQALQAYRSRLRELSVERADAEANRDFSRLEVIDAESGEIEAELRSVMGLGGRVRQTGGASERARKAVYNRIRAAIKRIGEEHPLLGKHLDRSVTTGSSCTYQPESKVEWNVEN